jgi:hypothetical protein
LASDIIARGDLSLAFAVVCFENCCLTCEQHISLIRYGYEKMFFFFLNKVVKILLRVIQRTRCEQIMEEENKNFLELKQKFVTFPEKTPESETITKKIEESSLKIGYYQKELAKINEPNPSTVEKWKFYVSIYHTSLVALCFCYLSLGDYFRCAEIGEMYLTSTLSYSINNNNSIAFKLNDKFPSPQTQMLVDNFPYLDMLDIRTFVVLNYMLEASIKLLNMNNNNYKIEESGEGGERKKKNNLFSEYFSSVLYILNIISDPKINSQQSKDFFHDFNNIGCLFGKESVICSVHEDIERIDLNDENFSLSSSS